MRLARWSRMVLAAAAPLTAVAADGRAFAESDGKTVRQRLLLQVDGLPAWAKGTFNGAGR